MGETPVQTVQITEKAAERLKALLESQNKDRENYGLRVGVKGGGCSGYTYAMDIDEKKEGDLVFEKDGVKVFVDPKSYIFLIGAVVDYKESLTMAGFVIENPNVSATCGCGVSFSIDRDKLTEKTPQ